MPAGTYGLQVRADVPVVAAGVVQRRTAMTAPGDFAWSSSTHPITGVAGMPLPGSSLGAPVSSSLTLASTGAQANVEVVTTDATGTATSRRLTLQADTATSLDLGGAATVWVHRLAGKGELRAGVVATATDAKGELISVVPLSDSALRTTTVGLLEVPE
jgi:hypothetical protein